MSSNQVATKSARTRGKTTPVGRYSPGGDSPYGLADMGGNVWEWCSTRTGFDYPYSPDDGREDLSGGDEMIRVLRGGSYYNDKDAPRCGFRDWSYLWDWADFRGFRCCCATSSNDRCKAGNSRWFTEQRPVLQEDDCDPFLATASLRNGRILKRLARPGSMSDKPGKAF